MSARDEAVKAAAEALRRRGAIIEGDVMTRAECLRAASAAVDAAAPILLAEWEAEVQRLRAERDMFRDKAHRFIGLSSRSEVRIGELVSRLQVAILRAESQAVGTVPSGHLRWILGDDEPAEGMTLDDIADLANPTTTEDTAYPTDDIAAITDAMGES